MSTISDQVAYLKGLADGLKVSDKDDNGKLMLAIIDALGTVAGAIGKLEAAQKELDEYVEDIDEDLSEIEDALFGDEDDDEDGCQCGHHHHHSHFLDDEDEDDEDDGLIEYDCPHCETTIFFDGDAFSMEDEHLCPNCGKPVFGDTAEDGEDDDQ